jgi:hypothetical protein
MSTLKQSAALLSVELLKIHLAVLRYCRRPSTLWRDYGPNQAVNAVLKIAREFLASATYPGC